MKIRELVGVAHAFTCPFACPSGVMAKKSWPVQFFVWFFRSYWDDWAQWPWVEAASEFRFNAPPRLQNWAVIGRSLPCPSPMGVLNQHSTAFCCSPRPFTPACWCMAPNTGMVWALDEIFECHLGSVDLEVSKWIIIQVIWYFVLGIPWWLGGFHIWRTPPSFCFKGTLGSTSIVLYSYLSTYI